jgi:Replication protein A interacting C-terminal
MTSTTSTEGPHRRQTRLAQQRTQLHEHWKDSLRQACVARARKNRKDLLWKKRHLLTEEVVINSGYTTPNKRGNDDDVRNLVAQELRQQGVAVVTPVVSHHGYYSEESGLPHSLPHHHHQQQHSRPLDGDSHVISEEELYELLQEVEAELRRNEEEFVEEILEEEERWHKEAVDHQIARYEEWEDSLANTSSDDEIIVICPICCEATLRQQSHTHKIVCSNDVCQFHISDQTLSLPELQERLKSAFDQHSSVGCSCTLTIGILHKNDYTDDPMEGCGTLYGSCQECDTLISIA